MTPRITSKASRSDIAGWRLANQGLIAPVTATPAEIVRRLGAVQAQDFAGAKWALGIRSSGLTDAEAEGAFAEGEVIRTHVLRPTWHLVAPEDLRWMLALTGPRIAQAMSSYNRKLGLDAKAFRRGIDAMVRALEGGRFLTRAELSDALRGARVNTEGTQRLAHLVMQAELDAVICSGPRRGKQFTYALVDERVPPTMPLDRDEALLALAARYFASRSPATTHDFAWWSGLTVGDAQRAIAAAGPALERVEIEGKAYWIDPACTAPVRTRRTLVHLLPNYDEYFIGFRDRSAIGERLRSLDLVTGGDALVAHVIAMNGQLVGGWRRAVTADSVVLRLQLLSPLTDRERAALRSAAEAHAEFSGLALVLEESKEPQRVRRARGTVRTVRPSPP